MSTTLSKNSPVRQTIPSLRGHWLRGNLDEFMRGPFDFYEHNWRACGDVAGVRLANMRFTQIIHPDHILRVLQQSNGRFRKGPGWKSTRIVIGKGLITAEPDEWLPNRRALQPAFLRSYHEKFAASYSSTIRERTLPRLHEIAQRGEAVPVYKEMVQVTLQNATRTLFGADITTQKETLIPHISSAFHYINKYDGIPLWKRIVGPYVKNSTHARFRQSRATLRQFADDLVSERLASRARGEEQTDLLSRLLFERDGETKRVTSPAYLRDEILTFLFAAHETTAITLSWMWARLAQNPEIEAQLHEELDRVLDGRAATLEDLPNLPFGRMIIEETLRLHPPVWVMLRETTQAEEFGEYSLPKGSQLLLMPLLTHRHPEFWTEPERFEPQRFTPENSANRHRGAYVPFGGGTRQCIGKRVAMIEAQLVLSNIAQHFKLRFVPNYQLKPVAGITLHLHQNLPMIFQPRFK